MAPIPASVITPIYAKIIAFMVGRNIPIEIMSRFLGVEHESFVAYMMPASRVCLWHPYEALLEHRYEALMTRVGSKSPHDLSCDTHLAYHYARQTHIDFAPIPDGHNWQFVHYDPDDPDASDHIALMDNIVPPPVPPPRRRSIMAKTHARQRRRDRGQIEQSTEPIIEPMAEHTVEMTTSSGYFNFDIPKLDFKYVRFGANM